MKEIPKEIKKYFKRVPVKFEISKFEEYMLQDIYEADETSKIKLNRDVTKDFMNEINLYISQKRNIRYSVKGETRDGKSLMSMRILSYIMKKRDSCFNTNVEHLVCGNQIEYRKKLKNAQFGDVFLVDENFFNNSGLGANIEQAQLKDYNAIIAKKNISVIFINPEKFLNVGATLGISTYGRDPENWLSRILIYKFKDNWPYLIGFAVIDVGELFREFGCYIYKFTGGCTNPKKTTLGDIPRAVRQCSSCIPNEVRSDPSSSFSKDLDTEQCPFYNICNHGLCKYEHKKDTWIDKEMKGGLDERTYERFRISILIIIDLFDEISENGTIKLTAKSGKDLKNRVRLKLPNHTNTKMGIGEYDELIEIIKTNCDIDMLAETLTQLEDEDLIKKVKKIDYDEEILRKYDELLKSREKPKD